MNQFKARDGSASRFSFDMLEFRPEWQFDDAGSGVYYHSGAIPGKLFFTSLGGDIQYAVAQKGIPYVERVFADGLFDGCEYIRIADYSGVHKASINSRILYANTLNGLNEKYRCRPVATYICGASQLMRAMLRIFANVVSQRFVFVASVEEAFQRINNEAVEQVSPEQEELVISRREIEEFAALCGNLLFDDRNADAYESDDYYLPEHPLNELYRIILLLRSDLLELRLRQEEQARETKNALEDSRSLNEKLAEEKRKADEKDKIQQELIENLKKARLEAESADKAKSEFLANISHEVRTPLHAIIGMTELLVETKLDKDQRYYTDTLFSSARMLLTLINDILDFSRIDAGRVDADKEVFNVKDLFGDIIAIMKEKANNKGLVLAADIDEKIPCTLIGYAKYLKQVLLNLVQNAIKFTCRGQVLVAVNMVSESDDEVVLNISVKDTGIGIPPDQQEQIFQPFTQIDASSTRKEGGTGLGLAIVSKLVSFMGGDIQLESIERKGSMFTFSLCLERANDTDSCSIADKDFSSDERGAVLAGSRVQEKKKVLLVEDNAINQKVALAMLEKMGYLIDIAFNGAEAVEALCNDNYGLVLMDLQMPVMDGFEAARTIRKSPDVLDNNVPIVAMTANVTKEDRQQCLDAGMDDYIPKPVERKVMTGMLQRWLPLTEAG